MGAITKDVFFLLQGLYSRTRFEGLLNKDFISSFFQRQCVVNDLTILPQFSFLFFFLNCRVALNGVRSSFVQLACQQENIMEKIYYSSSCISIRRISELEWTTRGSPFGIGSLQRKYIARRAVRLSALFILLKTLSRQSLSITILARYNVVKQITCL